LFGHHHRARAATVSNELSSSISENAIRDILQNQYDLFYRPAQVQSISWLDARYSLFTNLRNTNKGGYSSAIDQAVDKYNEQQSDGELKITKCK
jgi:hypothetical protein